MKKFLGLVGALLLVSVLSFGALAADSGTTSFNVTVTSYIDLAVGDGDIASVSLSTIDDSTAGEEFLYGEAGPLADHWVVVTNEPNWDLNAAAAGNFVTAGGRVMVSTDGSTWISLGATDVAILEDLGRGRTAQAAYYRLEADLEDAFDLTGSTTYDVTVTYTVVAN